MFQKAFESIILVIINKFSPDSLLEMVSLIFNEDL